MTVSNTLTWDEDPPRRPGLSDITGGTKEDDPSSPPDPITMPTASEHNQSAAQIAALGVVAPLARLYVTFSGGTPSIANVLAPGTNVVAGDFTVVDNAAGDTTIHWASSVLPPVSGGPSVSVAGDTEIDRARAYYTTVSSNQAVRVKTKLSSTGTDANFVVDIY